METNVFLGSLFLDLKGTSFLLMKNCILFSYQPQQKIYFAMGDLKMLPSFETHHMYIYIYMIVFLFVDQFLFLTQCSISFIAHKHKSMTQGSTKNQYNLSQSWSCRWAWQISVSHPDILFPTMDWSSSSRGWKRAVVPAGLCVTPAIAVLADPAGILALLPVPGQLGAGGAVV